MNLPIRFPNDADLIAEDAARFRALTAEEQVRALGDCFRDYQFLRTASGRAEEIDRFAEEEERLAWKAVQEFSRRHSS